MRPMRNIVIQGQKLQAFCLVVQKEILVWANHLICQDLVIIIKNMEMLNQKVQVISLAASLRIKIEVMHRDLEHTISILELLRTKP